MTTDTQAPKHYRISPRLESFINLYATGTLSATEAYKQAGFSPHGAGVEANKALKKPHVAKAIAVRKSQLKSTNTHATPEFVMQTLVREAQGAGPDTTSAARVSATKALADILGLQNSNAQATDGFKTMLEALGRGIQAQKEAKSDQIAAKVHAPEPIEAARRRVGWTDDHAQAHEERT